MHTQRYYVALAFLLAASVAGPIRCQTRAIDLSAAGTSINRRILGQNAYCGISPSIRQRILDVSYNNSIIGIAGGLYADTYNWKTLVACFTGPETTLQMMREARDRNSDLVIIANVRGIGSPSGSSFAYTDKSVTTLSALAADWVRYVNKIVPNFCQGEPIAGRDKQIVDSLQWGSSDKLPKIGDKPVRKVTYWEIGNEPEVNLDVWYGMSAEEYLSRYKAISPAMLAEDPTIKIGPCITTVGSGGNAWLQGVLNDPACKVDFVAYHPYGPLYWLTKNVSGGVLDAPTLESGLNYIKGQQQTNKLNVVNALVTAGRDPSTPLVLSEYNPESWEGIFYYGLHQTVAEALGEVETIFTFAELGIHTAHFFVYPTYPSATIETPVCKVFEELQNYMGDKLMDSYSDGSFRLYTTKESSTGAVALWAANMSDTLDKTLTISLTNLGFTPTQIKRMTLAATSGDTSLVTRNASSEVVNWTATNLLGQLDPSGFTMTFEDATLTLLIVR